MTIGTVAGAPDGAAEPARPPPGGRRERRAGARLLVAPGRRPAGLDALVERAVDVDAVAPISGHVLDAVRAGAAVVLTAPGAAADEPAGVAIALAHDPAEVAVAPDRRRQGWGTALVRAAIERQGAVWAYGDLPAARALAARLDLHPTRVLLQMRRTLPIGPGGHRPSRSAPAPAS